RKPQTISTFNVETPLSHSIPVVSTSDRDPEPGENEPHSPDHPQRFVSLFFDDMHLVMQDAVSVRAAGAKILDAMRPTDRVGIYSSSGQVKQDFTGDRERLKQTLNQITPRPLNATGFHDCPDISYYQADLIENRSDQQALAVAAEEAVQC